jgi:predicted DCC family thiol-disulfide oxidoreductase YuxK
VRISHQVLCESTVERNAELAESWRIKLLHDGLCPVCSREVRLLRRLDRGRGKIAFEDIAAPGFAPERYGLTLPQVVGSMHAIRPDGTVVRAMEVFREAYALVGLGWLLAPTRWPLLRPLFDRLYRIFARFRPRLSRFNSGACATTRCATGRS